MVRVAADRMSQGLPTRIRGTKSEMQVSAPAFYVSRGEITVANYRAFVDATGHVSSAVSGQRNSHCYAPDSSGKNRWIASPQRTPLAPGFVQGSDHPVVCVSWYDATAFAQWLARISGQPFRLLTEREHEYIARAGALTAYWWGPNADPTKANYEVGRNRSSLGVRGTVALNALPPNSWGFVHVLGNAAEWVENCWTQTSAPTAPASQLPNTPRQDCSRRVIRGGGWSYTDKDITAASRDAAPPHQTFVDVGFRVAADDPNANGVKNER